MTLLHTESERVRILNVYESVDKGEWLITCKPINDGCPVMVFTQQLWRAALCERRMKLDQIVDITFAQREDDWGIRSGFRNLVKVTLVSKVEAA